MSRRSRRTIATPHGPAVAHLWWPAGTPTGTVVLGHGAGGTSWSVDLLALTALAEEGVVVVLVEQPWRVAGRRVAAPPAHLDEAWLTVVPRLLGGRRALPGPLVVGGRSAGARVACRTAAAVDAAAVLALAFPLVPPARRRSGDGTATPVSRAHEIDEAGDRPVLVVQGRRDAFGSAQDVAAALGTTVSSTPGVTHREIVEAAGDHSFSADPHDVVNAARIWLSTLLSAH